MHINNLQRSVNDMEELVAIHDEPLGIADAADATPIDIQGGRIVFDRVTFLYGGHRTPLYDGLSVDIRAGERVGLVGRSGSGKTTFVKLVQRLYDVTSGRILIDGQDIAKATQQSLRSQIAIVQQDPVLFHRSLAENIAYGRPGASMAAIEQAARLANAHDFILRLPKGYGTLVGERGVKLSGGERQRVALARAFLADAPVLILDEATSSLNSESEGLIQQAMERLMKGRTSIVIAHRLSTVRSLDRILVFDAGRDRRAGHACLADRAARRHLSRPVRAAGDRVRPHRRGGVNCGAWPHGPMSGRPRARDGFEMKDLTHGSIAGHILTMAPPIVVGMITIMICQLVDLYFVADLGDAAVAGVAAAGNAGFLINAADAGAGRRHGRADRACRGAQGPPRRQPRLQSGDRPVGAVRSADAGRGCLCCRAPTCAGLPPTRPPSKRAPPICCGSCRRWRCNSPRR